MCAQYIEVLFT